MAKRIVTFLAVFFIANIARAQPATEPAGTGAGQRAGGRGEALAQRFQDAVADLNLTEEQKKKIADILQQQREQMPGMIQELRNLDQAGRQQKLREIMTTLRDKVRAELNEDQQKKFDEKIQTMRAGGRRGATPATQPEKETPPPPATAPAAASANAAGANPPRIEQMLGRLRESLAESALSDQQKKQTQTILDDGRKQFAEMRAKVGTGEMTADEVRNESPYVFAAMRDQLSGVLTRDQQEKLRSAMQSRAVADEKSAGPSSPAVVGTAMKEEPARRPELSQERPRREARRERNEQAEQAASPAVAAVDLTAVSDAGPKIASPAPEFTLESLSGRSVQLASFKNKPLVIEFGSYTSPSFREHAAKMEELAKQYGMRANFLIVYTKEAHAVGEWEVDRNRDEGVRVNKHPDLAARKAAAKDARQALKLSISMAVDSMDNAVAAAYGATENSAVVIGRDGRIIARQKWCDPFRLRAALDEALSPKSTTSAVG